jgi:hypothetical protein
LAWPPFLFFMPKVLSSTEAFTFLGAVRSFLGAMMAGGAGGLGEVDGCEASGARDVGCVEWVGEDCVVRSGW